MHAEHFRSHRSNKDKTSGIRHSRQSPSIYYTHIDAFVTHSLFDRKRAMFVFDFVTDQVIPTIFFLIEDTLAQFDSVSHIRNLRNLRNVQPDSRYLTHSYPSPFSSSYSSVCSFSPELEGFEVRSALPFSHSALQRTLKLPSTTLTTSRRRRSPLRRVPLHFLLHHTPFLVPCPLHRCSLQIRRIHYQVFPRGL